MHVIYLSMFTKVHAFGMLEKLQGTIHNIMTKRRKYYLSWVHQYTFLSMLQARHHILLIVVWAFDVEVNTWGTYSPYWSAEFKRQTYYPIQLPDNAQPGRQQEGSHAFVPRLNLWFWPNYGQVPLLQAFGAFGARESYLSVPVSQTFK